jgi:hypothetical protein
MSARFARPLCFLSPGNQDGGRDNQDGKFLIGRYASLLARI